MWNYGRYAVINGRRAPRQASGNIVQEKSYAFAVSIIRIARHLQLEHREWVLSKQLLRAGTSIGANVEEAIAAQSKKDFLSKMSIALKEARETHYWLRLIRDSGLMNGANKEAHLSACHELIRLLNSITLTTRNNLSATARGSRAHSTFIIPHSTLGS
jgi:four helix bundle protein